MVFVNFTSENSAFYCCSDVCLFCLLPLLPADCTTDAPQLHLHFLQHLSWYFTVLWIFKAHGFNRCSCRCPFGGLLLSNLDGSTSDFLLLLLPDHLLLHSTRPNLRSHFHRRKPHCHTEHQQRLITLAFLLSVHLSRFQQLHLRVHPLRHLQSHLQVAVTFHRVRHCWSLLLWLSHLLDWSTPPPHRQDPLLQYHRHHLILHRPQCRLRFVLF